MLQHVDGVLTTITRYIQRSWGFEHWLDENFEVKAPQAENRSSYGYDHGDLLHKRVWERATAMVL